MLFPRWKCVVSKCGDSSDSLFHSLLMPVDACWMYFDSWNKLGETDFQVGHMWSRGEAQRAQRSRLLLNHQILHVLQHAFCLEDIGNRSKAGVDHGRSFHFISTLLLSTLCTIALVIPLYVAAFFSSDMALQRPTGRDTGPYATTDVLHTLQTLQPKIEMGSNDPPRYPLVN